MWNVGGFGGVVGQKRKTRERFLIWWTESEVQIQWFGGVSTFYKGIACLISDWLWMWGQTGWLVGEEWTEGEVVRGLETCGRARWGAVEKLGIQNTAWRCTQQLHNMSPGTTNTSAHVCGRAKASNLKIFQMFHCCFTHDDGELNPGKIWSATEYGRITSWEPN